MVTENPARQLDLLVVTRRRPGRQGYARRQELGAERRAEAGHFVGADRVYVRLDLLARIRRDDEFEGVGWLTLCWHADTDDQPPRKAGGGTEFHYLDVFGGNGTVQGLGVRVRGDRVL